MNQKFTADEVRAEADFLSTYSRKPSHMLTNYADLLERREAGLTTDVVNAALKEFRRWADSEDTVAMDAALHLVWPVPLNGCAEAKLSERKTVHEWLNDLHIEREELGKPLCLLRRLRILCDRYQGTCDQLSLEMGKQIGWPVSADPAQPADSGRVELERWGLPDATRMAKRCEDGYWTPWHVAQAAVDALAAQSQGEAVALMSVTDDVTPVFQPLEGWRNLTNRNYTLYTAPPLAAQGQGEAQPYGYVYQAPDDDPVFEYAADRWAERLRHSNHVETPVYAASPAGVPDATEVHAALEAWKQEHKKLNDSMDSIRRFAAAPSAPEGE
jgi:hypothetical protein